jgi:hypothetical protein
LSYALVRIGCERSREMEQSVSVFLSLRLVITLCLYAGNTAAGGSLGGDRTAWPGDTRASRRASRRRPQGHASAGRTGPAGIARTASPSGTSGIGAGGEGYARAGAGVDGAGTGG